MERLTIDEIIAHCKRQTDGHERRMSAEQYETADMLNFFVQEYWEHRQVAEYLEELKCYRKAEEQGLLLRLPCKVGNSVYVPPYNKCIVKSFEWDVHGGYAIVGNEGLPFNLRLPFKEFGKTAFLTEAESALAEKGGAE